VKERRGSKEEHRKRRSGAVRRRLAFGGLAIAAALRLGAVAKVAAALSSVSRAPAQDQEGGDRRRERRGERTTDNNERPWSIGARSRARRRERERETVEGGRNFLIQRA
jgi:hypothetical protein